MIFISRNCKRTLFLIPYRFLNLIQFQTLIKAWHVTFWRENNLFLAYLTIASPMYNFPVWSAAIPLNILEMRMGIRFSRPPLIEIPRPWPVWVLMIFTGLMPSGGGPPFPCSSFKVRVCWNMKFLVNFVMNQVHFLIYGFNLSISIFLLLKTQPGT